MLQKNSTIYMLPFGTRTLSSLRNKAKISTDLVARI